MKKTYNKNEVIKLIKKFNKERCGWPWFEEDEEWIEENIKPKEDEKDRYYAPSIEEFHVGFEFEEKPKGCTEFEGWVKQTIHKGGSSIENHFKFSKLRVKYLDQEDIESLGFINSHNESVEDNIKTFHKAVHNTAILAKGFDVSILLNVDTNTVHVFDITKDKYPIFKGTIKNKSELKKVLEMLNIN